MKRGVSKIEDLKARSVVDPVTHCWHWQGARAVDGTPRIWTFDHERGEKRAMSGPKAVWNVAHGEPRAGCLVFRRCGSTDCVNPVHHGQARDKAEIGLHIRRAGWRKGTHVAERAANLVRAREAAGIVRTPDEIVKAIIEAPLSEPGSSVAARLGVTHQVVSRYRRQAYGPFYRYRVAHEEAQA